MGCCTAEDGDTAIIFGNDDPLDSHASNNAKMPESQISLEIKKQATVHHCLLVSQDIKKMRKTGKGLNGINTADAGEASKSDAGMLCLPYTHYNSLCLRTRSGFECPK